MTKAAASLKRLTPSPALFQQQQQHLKKVAEEDDDADKEEERDGDEKPQNAMILFPHGVGGQ